MATQLIEGSRVQWLRRGKPTRGDYVLYWMQQSQRAEHNPALEYAVQTANDLRLRLLVAFGLMGDYPEATARHYHFMLEGLAEVADKLRSRKIKFVVQQGGPADVAERLGRHAAVVVCDRGYLRHQKAWRAAVTERLRCPIVQIEGDVVVPVEEASDKAEFAARTLRPKLQGLRDDYLVELSTTAIDRDSTSLSIDSLDLSLDLALNLGEPAGRDAVVRDLGVNASVPPSPLFRGGTQAAKRVFRRFTRDRFSEYAEHRNQPQTNDVSHMSKYLHFGQISPVWLALQVRGEERVSKANRDAFLEELVVRRELAQNFVHYTEDYDQYRCLPRWARRTLTEHRGDPRPHTYTAAQLDAAQTHDPYWNAAMREMRVTGYMHNYMRMYWGKKILEWTNTPEHAYRVALALNNRYFIDGRDPNSFANIGWLFGLHDRPWAERQVFGKVRYMNAAGLKRKCDPDAYVQKVDALVREVHSPT